VVTASLQAALAGVHQAAVKIGDVGDRLGVGCLVAAPGLDVRPRLLAAGPGSGRQRGDPLRIPALALGRVGFQLRLGLAQPCEPAGLGGERGGQFVPAGVAVLAVLALVERGGLAQDLGDLGFELLLGAVGLLGGVGGQLGPVQRDGADPDHAGGGAQLQRGHQEASQGLLVAGAEARDGYVVGGLVAGQDPEGEVLVAVTFKLPGGAHPDGVGVQEHAEQELGVVGRVTVPVVTVGPVEGPEVDLVDHVQDEPGEVAVGEPVAQVRGQQEGLVAVTAQKVVGHGTV
jgi:hypothetical protein